MWHEARKQERKIRGMLVDYRRRAERRQDFYEKIKADPTQFMQIHGRKCKIHLDPAVAAAGESPAVMMPWQGQMDNLIDRFDGRAYLDIDRIPVVPKTKEAEDISADERHCNYERYRILAQNDFLGISEEKYLHQLYLEEQFGINAQLEAEKPKKKTGVGAAIPFTYEDSGGDMNNVPSFTQTIAQVTTAPSGNDNDESDSDLDVDVAIDVSKIDTAQAHELNACGRHYGMKSNDFYSFLTKDSDEADALKLAREEEQEKIMLSGRKSRRERRAQRERRFAGRPISPPSYAAKEDEPTFKDDDEKNDSAESRSSTPENSGKITYITSFGGEDELQPHSKISINFKNTKSQPSNSRSEISSQGVSYADKVKQNLEKLQQLNNSRARSSESPKKPLAYQRHGSSSRSRSRSRTRRHSRSSYRSRNTRRRISRSRSRSRRSVPPRRRNSRPNYRSSYSRQHNRRSYSSSSSTTPPPTTRRKSRKSSSSSSTSSTTSSSASSKSIASDASKSRSRSPLARSRSKSVPVKHDAPIIEPIQPTIQLIPVAVKEEPMCVEPQAPIKKYYGRRKEDLSSDDEMDVDEDDRSMDTSKQSSNVVTVSHASSSTKLGKQLTTNDNKATSSSKSFNPRDRLKRKMQILLNKQYKADKLAEIEKTERQVQQQQEREDEMRELALRLRRRQRELRHRYGTPTSSHSESSDRNSDDETPNVKPKDVPRNGGSATLKKSPILRSRSRSRGHSTNKRRRSYSRSRSRDHYRRKYRSRSRDRSYRDSYHRHRSRDRQRSRERQRSRSRSRSLRDERRRDDRGDRERSRVHRKLVDY